MLWLIFSCSFSFMDASQPFLSFSILVERKSFFSRYFVAEFCFAISCINNVVSCLWLDLFWKQNKLTKLLNTKCFGKE